MPENYYVFPPVDPPTVLEIASEYIKTKGAHPEFFGALQVRIVQPSFKTGRTQVTLIVADSVRGRERSALQAALRVFIAVFKRISGQHDPSRTSGEVEGAVPFIGVLPELLRSQQSRAQLLSPKGQAFLAEYPLRPQEHMLVAQAISSDRAATIYRTLQFYTTHVRVGVGESQGETFYLFHVSDDLDRGSDFRSALSADLLKDCVELDCYLELVSGLVVALPSDIVPHRDSLARFAEVVKALAHTMGRKPPSQDSTALAIGLAAGEHASLRYTADILFVEEWQAAPPTDSLTHFELLPLDNSAHGLKELRHQIDAAMPRIGYSLQLRPSSYRYYEAAEYDRLCLLLEKIQDRLIELESLEAKRPKLYRFTQAQLPQLADVLRSYRPDRLQQLKYGFQATTSYHREGLHFIFVDSGIEMSELDPLTWWEDSPTQPMEFWLDPHWAYHYQSKNQAQVFVPRGTRLYPSMHSWSVETFDEYLREILGETYHGVFDVQSISPRPIYIFDGDCGRDGNIRIMLLDLDAFVPVTSPRCLGWLNSNLHTLDRLGVEGFIAAVADQSSIELKTSAIQAETDSLLREFGEEAERIGESLAGQTRALFDILNTELNKIIADTEKFVNDAQSLNQRLLSLRILHAQTTENASAGEQLVRLAHNEAIALDKHVLSVKGTVERQLSGADQELDGLSHQVESRVQGFRQTQQEILATIEQLRELLRRRPRRHSGEHSPEPRDWHLK